MDTTPFKFKYIIKNDIAQNPQENALCEGTLVLLLGASAVLKVVQRAEEQEQIKTPYLSLHWSQRCDFQGFKKEPSIPGERYFPTPHSLQLTVLSTFIL